MGECTYIYIYIYVYVSEGYASAAGPQVIFCWFYRGPGPPGREVTWGVAGCWRRFWRSPGGTIGGEAS